MPGFVFDDPSLNQSDWAEAGIVLTVFYTLTLTALIAWKTGFLSEPSRHAALTRFREEKNAAREIAEEDFQTWTASQDIGTASEAELRKQYDLLPEKEKERPLERSIRNSISSATFAVGIMYAGVLTFTMLCAMVLASLTAPLVASVYSRVDPESGTIGSATHDLSSWLNCHYGYTASEEELRRVTIAMVEIDRGAALPSSVSGFLASPARPLNVPGADGAFFIRSEAGVWVILDGQGRPVESSRGRCTQ